MKYAVLMLALAMLSGCAYIWSDTGADGTPYTKAEPECRAKARESARQQLPDPYDRDYGPAGFPLIDRKDIEDRETARCLLDRGFTQTYF